MHEEKQPGPRKIWLLLLWIGVVNFLDILRLLQ
jgi:hypothetical protein